MASSVFVEGVSSGGFEQSRSWKSFHRSLLMLLGSIGPVGSAVGFQSWAGAVDDPVADELFD